MTTELQELRDVMIDLTGLLNRPQQDDLLLQAAGVELDRALFPLLVRIERQGAVGVVELADLAGRDYTTVSRQVAKLETLGLVTRSHGADKRVRVAAVTDKGREVTARLDSAREAMLGELFRTWEVADIATLVRLLRRLTEAAMARSRIVTTSKS